MSLWVALIHIILQWNLHMIILDTNVHFLDDISIGLDRVLVTNSSNKLTDTHQYQLATSCHPGREIFFLRMFRSKR